MGAKIPRNNFARLIEIGRLKPAKPAERHGFMIFSQQRRSLDAAKSCRKRIDQRQGGNLPPPLK